MGLFIGVNGFFVLVGIGVLVKELLTGQVQH